MGTQTLPSSAKKTASVLVTDDAKIIREMIKDAVIECGWKVAGEAANGNEAILLYKKLQPDLVTLDLVMPEFDGLHALRGIMESNPRARVLMVSALNQDAILREAMKLGARGSISKPFKKDGLLAAMANCLS